MNESPDSPHARLVTGRFVLLRHALPEGSSRPSHWDLMLEEGDWLQTWELMSDPFSHSPPISASGIARLLPPHRPHYLDYEGPVSNHRGEVRRVVWGEHTSQIDSTSGRWIATLTGSDQAGHRIHGTFKLPIPTVLAGVSSESMPDAASIEFAGPWNWNPTTPTESESR